jgi:hypothetical protein
VDVQPVFENYVTTAAQSKSSPAVVRDTVVISHKDTVFISHKDTVFVYHIDTVFIKGDNGDSDYNKGVRQRESSFRERHGLN